MPRGPREVFKNAILNVTSRGNNKRIIFRKNKDYIYFRNLLHKYKAVGKLKIYHYCLMPNHVHLLMKINDPESLARAMKGLQLAYFHYFRRKYGYVGRFWQGRFHSKLIKDEKYLLTAGLYIEANAVRAKIVEQPEEYEWSSYNAYTYGTKDRLVDWDPCYFNLSNREKEKQKIYKDIMERYLNMENDVL